MTGSDHKQNCNYGLEVLVTFINKIDHDYGWWHNIGPSSTNEDETFNYVFPSLNNIFGIHKGTMNIFLLEVNCLKKKGNTHVIDNKGCDFLMSMVDISSNVEKTMTRLANKKGNFRFIEIGNTSLSPKMIWDDYLKHPRRVHPPTKIASREIIRSTSNEIMSIIKNSKFFINMVELYMQHNNFNRKRSSTNKESTKNNQNEEELEEDSNSSESEEDEDEK